MSNLIKALQLGAFTLTVGLFGCNSILGNPERHLAASGGSGGTGGMSSDAGGGAGDAGTDPCVGVTCNTPPASQCESGSQFKAYDKVGSCSAGNCTYASQDVSCTCAAGACTTDPCLGVACATPPTPSCSDANTLVSYAAVGACDEGSCSYTATSTMCASGCSNGACASDPCVGVTCNSPPPNVCASSTELTAYSTTGSCSAGKCSYGSLAVPCACSSNACTTDPCASVTCNMPPTSVCKDASTQRTYAAAGTCNGGSCSYAPTDTPCSFGCANGACKADPCAGVSCNTPPGPTCSAAGKRETYAATGTCSAGICSYAPTDTACGSNLQCSAGACAPCDADSSCGPTCAACTGATPKCNTTGAMTSACVACLTSADCTSGACDTTSHTCVQASCAGLNATCGPTGLGSCCASSVLPAGSFTREDAAEMVTVSSFRLDTYEITVGRFRNFAAVFSPNMIAAGAGKNPNNFADPGWDSTWNASLPPTQAQLLADVVNNKTQPDCTYTGAAMGNENRPMNCIDWYMAEAFCIWDGGRLPTDAEWAYAAQGGSQARVYPWAASVPPIDCTHANYNPGTACSATGPNDVGSESPTGDARWGQADMSGNVWEWTQDYQPDSGTYPATCSNCANLTMSNSGRSTRGGGYSNDATYLYSYLAIGNNPGLAANSLVGARCARSAP